MSKVNKNADASDRPIISIVTVVLDNKAGLDETIKSVRLQNISVIEYIIIDGGSTDGTLEVIKENLNIVSKFVSEKDGGIYAAMNKGIDLCTGLYAVFLNSGDTLTPGALAAIINIYNEVAADLYFGDLNIISGRGNFKKIKGSERLLFWDMTLNHPTCYIKSDILKKCKFDENFRIAADYELVLRLKRSGYTFKKLNITLANMIAGGASSNKMLSLKERSIVHQKYFGGIYALLRKYFSHLKNKIHIY